MGRGRGRGPQAGTSGVQGRVYAITSQAESADQPIIQGTFLLSRLWARVLFDSGASHSFIAASVVIELGLEVEILEEPLYVSSPLGIRARIGMICRGCELEISGALRTVDLRIMNMSEFDVILGMDWLTAYKVVIDCERRRVTANTQDGTRVVFQGDKHDVFTPDSIRVLVSGAVSRLASKPYPRGRGETRLGSTSSSVRECGCFIR